MLRPEGRLVVVTPAADHLGELVGPLGLLRVDPDKAARLAATLEPHLEPVATTGHRRGAAPEPGGRRDAGRHGPARPAPGARRGSPRRSPTLPEPVRRDRLRGRRHLPARRR